MNKDTHAAGFTLFAFTWAIAALFHQLSFEGWRWYDIKGNILSAAVLFVLWKPSSWKRFALYLLVDWCAVAWTFPIHSNHVVFSWIVNGTLLATLAMVSVQNKPFAPDLSSKWYEAFAPWLRIELCILYFFAAFHKLNTAYLDPDWSCGASLYVEIKERFPLLPVADWTKVFSIYGTLLFEALIPILLLFHRSRATGIILGMIFHLLLALNPQAGLFSFSSTMNALFTLFLPLNVAETSKPRVGLSTQWHWGLIMVAFVFILCIFQKWLPSGLHLEKITSQHLTIGFIAYCVYLIIATKMLIRAMADGIESNPLAGSWRTHWQIFIFPLLLVINGFGPYIGLKTQTSFSMFSNLHTENGMSNHLIVPSGIQLTNWQYDLVEIIDSNDPNLLTIRDKGLLLVYLDLRRMRSGAESDFRVTFLRKGKIEVFDISQPDTHSTIPELSVLSKRYFYFRVVEPDPTAVRCKH